MTETNFAKNNLSLDWVKAVEDYGIIYQRNAQAWLGVWGASNGLSQLTSLYMQNLFQWQALTQQFTQHYLQMLGLPTRQDYARLSRQFYEIAEQLDDMSARLEQLDLNSNPQAQALKAEVDQLQAALARHNRPVGL